jgi:kumamolisin
LPDQSYWAAIPPGQRRFLTRDELVARYGATEADLDKVAAFARSYGFEVLETSAARRVVRVSGTVAQANQAFAVDLGRYESSEESYRGREGAVHVPNEVADVIEGVFGLDNRRMADQAGTVVPPGAVSLAPPNVATLYDFPPLNAVGQTIGILEFGGGFAQSDLDTFCSGLVPPIIAPTVTILDGTTGTSIPAPPYAGNAGSPDPGDLEVALDCQVVAGVAQGANIVMFFASGTGDQDWINAVTSAIYNSEPLTALSISAFRPEKDWSGSALGVLDELFAEAAYLGITVFGASGDYGSNCKVNDNLPHVYFPASDPWVTACGGTFLATKPASEGTWNDWVIATVPGPTPGSTTEEQIGGATGGGISTIFPAPKWQSGLTATATDTTGLPTGPVALNATGRGVPDVAGNASPFTGYLITLYGSASTVGGGTSAVAPLYASLMAIIAAKAGWPLGYLNPILYKIAATPGQNAIVPINDGATNLLNESYVLPGDSNPANPCASYSSTPWFSTSQWNACTGLGRIDGNNLLKALIPLEQELRPFDAVYPFSFGGGGEWLAFSGDIGSDESGEDLVAGQQNSATVAQCTIVQNIGPNNAVLAADNQWSGNGAVGLYGRSQGSTWSIGVGGVSKTGCGVYGIAGGSAGSTGPNGVGVAGRAMGGLATEYLPLEEVVGEPVGVLGQSTNGPGVRGHGGHLLKQPEGGTFVPAVPAAPGGVFSSGRLQDQQLSYIFPNYEGPVQTVSLDSLAQARLVPSIAGIGSTDTARVVLPLTGQVGDLFLVVPHSTGVAGFFEPAQLYICTAVVPHPGDKLNPKGPRWQQVQLGPLQRGGPL